MLISSNSITFEKCLVFNVRSGISLATQMPAIRVSGMPMPSPLLSKDACICAEITEACRSKGRIVN